MLLSATCKQRLSWSISFTCASISEFIGAGEARLRLETGFPLSVARGRCAAGVGRADFTEVFFFSTLRITVPEITKFAAKYP
jgi:hypothetical protein